MIGRDLKPFYRLEAELSASWLAVSYRARRLESGSVVALKHFRAPIDHAALQSVDAAASAWEALRHPNINALVDRGAQDGRPWIAARWLQGETLAARIAGGPLQLSAAVTMLRPLLAALASAHAAGLVHGNLKPSNVFLEVPATQRRERVQLLDPILPATLARGGMPAARSPYLAPELVAGRPGSARGDVFAAGMLAIAMLNGAESDAGESLEKAAEPARSVAGVSGALTAWLRGATASEPTRRFCDAGEMLAELIACMPRELRSGMMPSDPPPRNNPKQAPAPAARATSERPTPPQRMAAPPPSPTEPPDSVSVPPPQRVPVEARGWSTSAFPSASETRAAPEPRPSQRDEGGQSLRPIEAPASMASVARWPGLRIAAGILAVVVIGGLALWQSFDLGARPARVARSENAQPEALPARTTVTVEMAPQPPPPAPPPPSAATPAHDPPPPIAFSLVAAPGHPPLRDPWSDFTPPELKRLHESAIKGALADEAKVDALLEYSRDHRDDARGYLVIGQLYLNRHWRSDCVVQWTTALQLDPGVRGAPEVLPGLLEVIAQGKAAPAAQALVLKAYGTEAVAAIQDARDSARSEGGVSRLHNLYLKIADSAGQP